MRVLMLSVAAAFVAAGCRRSAAETDPTVWWRTHGAEVVEQHNTDDGERACSLVMSDGDNAVVFMWRKNAGTSMFVQHPGWRFGNSEGVAQVEIQIGDVWLGGAVDGSDGPRLLAVDYQSWVRAHVDQPVADLLLTQPEIRVVFPGGQAEGLSFPLNRSKMPALVRALKKCQAAIGV